MLLEASPFIDDLTASVPTLGGLHSEKISIQMITSIARFRL
jgi:hypothetical protein